MKRSACVVAVLIVFVCFVSAYQNTYTNESFEFRQLVSLYRISGMTMHGVVTPVSSDDMLFLLDEIPLERLPSEVRGDVISLRESLQNPKHIFGSRGILFDAGIVTSPIGVYNSNETVHIRNLPFAFKDMDPLLLFEGSFFLGEHFVGSMGLDLIKSADQWDFSSFDTNLETELNGSKMDFYRPHKAYFSSGFNRFSFILGRDRMSAGNGFSGNLTIGNNFVFQDFAKVSILYPFVSYNMTIASFDPNETNTAEEPAKTAKNSLDFSTWDDYHPEVINHRLSLNFFNKVTLTLTEGVMQFTDNAFGTVKMLNPFNILHNQFTFRNHRINNFFAIEVDAAICPGFSMHFQFIGDQIQLKFEHADTTPNSYGLLLNFAHSFSVLNSLATIYLEGVYTSPTLYLKDDKTSDGGQIPPHSSDEIAYDHRHTDLIFGNKMTGYDDYQYMGYVYGPDAIVFSLGFESVNAKSAFSSSVLFMIHGENRIDKDSNAVPKAPVLGDDESKFIFTPYVTGERVPEYTLLCRVNYESKLSKAVSFRVGVAFDNRWNYENDKGVLYSNAELLLAVRIDAAGFVPSFDF